ncbi:hypothetical protein [Sphingopyxis terrae]|uniref:hypothetical protein n=1 Tax=Sphingopyxis terrae TaxID=33052 RepID=UPI003F818046
MTLTLLAALFEEHKLSIVSSVGLGKDALHIYFGLALFLAVRLIWRRRGGGLIAWAAVLVMASGGEWLDLQAEISRSAIQPDAAHWHDIWNTMFWPTVLLIVGRWLAPRADAPAPTAISGENAERGFEQA